MSKNAFIVGEGLDPPLHRLSKNRVIASQCAHYSALRAAFGGCAMYAACGPCGVAIS